MIMNRKVFKLYDDGKLVRTAVESTMLFPFIKRRLLPSISDAGIETLLLKVESGNLVIKSNITINRTEITDKEYEADMASQQVSAHTWSDGCSEHCGTCAECNLSVCTVCRAYEGGLTTHCPGAFVPVELSDRVYGGEIDFRSGKWREGLTNRGMATNPVKALEQEQKYLQELIDEGANYEYIDDSLEYIRYLQKWLSYKD